MTAAKSSTLHDFSRAQARLGKTARRVTLCIFATNAGHPAKKKKKKGAYLANSSLFRKLTDRLPKYFCYFREDGLMRNK